MRRRRERENVPDRARERARVRADEIEPTRKSPREKSQ